MAMASPTLFICVVSVESACGTVAVRQHLEGKARNLGHDVINARLEMAGARRLRRFTVRINRALEFCGNLHTIGH